MDPLHSVSPTTTLAFALSLVAIALQLLSISPHDISSSSVLAVNLDNDNVSRPQCPHHQKLALLQYLEQGYFVRRGFVNSSSKLESWNSSTDCCSWGGITCDEATGHVISLDLNGYEDIYSYGQIGSSIFSLSSLQRLNLSGNFFDHFPIPSGLSLLANLTHLDLSHCFFGGKVPLSLSKLRRLVHLDLGDNYDFDVQPIPSWLGLLSNLSYLRLSDSNFAGQVPLALSKLTGLVTLDLSSTDMNRGNELKLENPNLAALVQNLSSLRQLSLDKVDMSRHNFDGEWMQALTIVTPDLEALGLRGCGIPRPIHPSLLQLPFLRELDLSNNNLSLEVTKILGNLPSLRSLRLSNCGLYGEFPKSTFLTPKLIALDISDNPNLTIVFPEFPQTIALHSLKLDKTNFPPEFPASFVNLTSLKDLSLSGCNLSGLLSSLPLNNFSRIELMDLSSNNFIGSVPSYFFSHPSLQQLNLNDNQLSGIDDLYNASSSTLIVLCLGGNKLHGPLPTSIFQLKNIAGLDLHSNNFSDTVELGMFLNLQNLSGLDLSNSGLSIIKGNDTSSFTYSTQIQTLVLESCNISEFPRQLQNQSNIDYLDLSNNQIQGEIPAWIWNVGSGSLEVLNLSNNLLESFEYPLPDLSSSELLYVDLHSNKLRGSLPNLQKSIRFQDYSNNNFTSIISSELNFTYTESFSLSKNKVTGEIPLSICEAYNLEVLNLSNNNFTGSIPQCLIEKVNTSLRVLNLRENCFHGSLPQAFKDGCSLQTFNLHGNQLNGWLPNTLVNCKALEVLDVGNNQLHGPFPFWIENMPSLRVLILKSNFFHGPIVRPQKNYLFLPSIQIVDLSSNYFGGSLPKNFFWAWKAMTREYSSWLNTKNQTIKYLIDGRYYQDSVVITLKSHEMELVKILNALIVIDLSSNKFQGQIPQSIGNLKSLHALNLSNNEFASTIPVCLENLSQLESLDLSKNKLLGTIPWQLTKLTFLAVLNLSENLLTGRIPQKGQFLTFNKDSFLDDIGLCGPPLEKKCEDLKSNSGYNVMKGEAMVDREMMWIGFGVGYGVGLGGILWTLILWEKGGLKFKQIVDKFGQWLLYGFN